MPNEQNVQSLALPSGATVLDALKASGLLDKKFADDSLNLVAHQTPVGIYGERVGYDEVLENGDRVEVYRPLITDPMEARRARAKIQKQQHKKK